MPASDPITAVANAVTEMLDKVVSPLMTNYNAHKYDNEQNSRLQGLESALASGNATTVGNYFNGLCNDAGVPVGVLGGKSIEVPLEYLDALGRSTVNEVIKTKLLADFVQGVKPA